MVTKYRFSFQPCSDYIAYPLHFGQNVNSFILSLTRILLGDRKLDKLGENLKSVKNDLEEMRIDHSQVIWFT